MQIFQLDSPATYQTQGRAYGNYAYPPLISMARRTLLVILLWAQIEHVTHYPRRLLQLQRVSFSPATLNYQERHATNLMSPPEIPYCSPGRESNEFTSHTHDTTEYGHP